MVNPLAQGVITPQRPTNFQTEIAGVRISESGCNSALATVAMNQRQRRISHLPCVLNDFVQHLRPHNFQRVTPVKINFHSANGSYRTPFKSYFPRRGREFSVITK